MQAALIEAARWSSWAVFHPFDSRRSEPGWPDLAMTRDGVLLAWEVKTARGRVTADQLTWLTRLDAVAGIDARVIRPAVYDWALDRLTARPGSSAEATAIAAAPPAPDAQQPRRLAASASQNRARR